MRLTESTHAYRSLTAAPATPLPHLTTADRERVVAAKVKAGAIQKQKEQQLVSASLAVALHHYVRV